MGDTDTLWTSQFTYEWVMNYERVMAHVKEICKSLRKYQWNSHVYLYEYMSDLHDWLWLHEWFAWLIVNTWVIYMTDCHYLSDLHDSNESCKSLLCSQSRDTTHFYVTWRISMCHDSFIRDIPRAYVTWHTYNQKSEHLGAHHGTWPIHTWHDSFTCAMTHSYMAWLIRLIRMSRHVFPCAMTCSRVTSLIHT